MITENLQTVERNMEAALLRSGRHPGEAKLIAVSKTKPVERILEAYRAGIRDFGENKVQELIDKQEQLPPDIRWHMIGHLQRNKVKYLIGKTVLIHSVDSLRLAEEIEKESAKKNTDTDILIEVNMAGEKSKFGALPQDVLPLVCSVSGFSHVHIKGLMTVAPFTEEPEENRKYFRALKQLAVDITRKNVDNVSMQILSMGMTNDYETAIEEGSTHVRVGTGIFGMRSLADIQ